MKRVIAAVLLLTAAVTLAVWSERIYSKHMNLFARDIEMILADCDSKPKNEIIKNAELTAEDWHKKDDLLHSLVVHEGMDELEEIITSLPEVAKRSDTEELKSKCIEALNIIQNLLESEKMSIGNIL